MTEPLQQQLQAAVDSNNPYGIIGAAKQQFLNIAEKEGNGILYEKEARFAYQALVKNDFALKTAMKNPESVFNAVINIASVGLSLNPATAYAYLVPRDQMICLDISYMGLIKIATDSGSIMWAKADLVYANDKFTYHGPAAMPEHQAEVFGDRGDFIGVYCIAKTNEGDILVETMNAEEVYKIRDESASVKHARNQEMREKSPWYRYEGEMTKKACIKRASKTWPKTEKHERIQKAVEVINETEGSDWEPFTPEEKELFDQWVELKSGAALMRLRFDDEEKYKALYYAKSNEIPRGGKGKFKADLGEILQEAEAMIDNCCDALVEALATNDEGIIHDITSELSEDEDYLVRKMLDPRQIEQLDQMIEAAA